AGANGQQAAAGQGQGGRGQGGRGARGGQNGQGNRGGNRGATAGAAAAADAAADDAGDDGDVAVAGLVGNGGGGLTALILASREGDLESTKLLVEAGANVNQTTNDGWTPLLTATNN